MYKTIGPDTFNLDIPAEKAAYEHALKMQNRPNLLVEEPTINYAARAKAYAEAKARIHRERYVTTIKGDITGILSAVNDPVLVSINSENPGLNNPLTQIRYDLSLDRKQNRMTDTESFDRREDEAFWLKGQSKGLRRGIEENPELLSGNEELKGKLNNLISALDQAALHIDDFNRSMGGGEIGREVSTEADPESGLGIK